MLFEIWWDIWWDIIADICDITVDAWICYQGRFHRHLTSDNKPFLRPVMMRTHVFSLRIRERSRRLGNATNVDTRWRRRRSAWWNCNWIDRGNILQPSKLFIMIHNNKILLYNNISLRLRRRIFCSPPGESKWERACHGDVKSGQSVPFRFWDVPREAGDVTPPEALPDDNAQEASRPPLLQRPCSAWWRGPGTGSWISISSSINMLWCHQWLCQLFKKEQTTIIFHEACV